MTDEQATLEQIRSVVAKLPIEQREQTESVAAQIRCLLDCNPGPAHIALALVGAELAAESPE